MKKKILLINVEFPPVSGPGVQRILKFTKYLPRKHWWPTIITATEALTPWGDTKDYTLCKEIHSGVEIYRVKWTKISSYATNIASILGNAIFFLTLKKFHKDKIKRGLYWRLNEFFLKIVPEVKIDWIVKATLKALKLHCKKKFDVILTSGPCHSTHLIGLFIKILTNIKWIADFRDPWSDCTRKEEDFNLSIRLEKFKEKNVLKKANIVTVPTEGCKVLLQSKVKEKQRSKIKVIFNGYDEEDVNKVIKHAISTNGRLHFHHNGTLYARRSCKYFFQALQRLNIEKPEIFQYLEFTFTHLPESEKTLAKECNILNVIKDIGRLEHIDSLNYSCKSDVLLLLSDKFDKSSLSCIPAKVFEYVALGKPILALLPRGGDLDRLLSSYKNAEIVEYDDVKAIFNAIVKIHLSKTKNMLAVCDIPVWIEEYSRAKQTYNLVGLMEELYQR